MPRGGSLVVARGLGSARARTVWRGRAGRAIARDTAIGTGGAVAFVTSLRQHYSVLLARPRHQLVGLLGLDVSRQRRGNLAIEGLDPAGQRLTVVRNVENRSTRISVRLAASARR